ncbi:hypothetical protein L9F63_011919 [Diploptera punctata]|uniref:Tetratricopeptide repeat protein 29 n=1 Tax=Diploptera punctata TaxID=6984 RepID=A0AAD8ADW1_DIPPU|nr:hypothetical protein L9F63_011919 [Diploptera punctata]
MNQLFLLNEKLRNDVGDESFLKGQPRLIDEHLYLDKLRLGLTEAEVARQFGEIADECWILLELALFFMRRNDHLSWIAESLFVRCLQVSRNHHSDGGRYHATLKYLYGRFLLEQLQRPADACSQLQQARTASIGKVWRAETQLGQHQETIFVESCSLLVKALLLLAEEITEDEPKRAIRLCNQAKRRASEARSESLESEALLQLGMSQMANGDYNSAIRSFNLFIKRKEREKSVEVCNAYLNLAVCYKMTGNTEATLSNLTYLRDTAESEQLIQQIGAADRFLGEFYLTMGFNDRAISHLSSSFSLYHKNGFIQELEEIRALGAVASGQGIFHTLVDNILENSDSSLNSLYRWKNLHTPLLRPDKSESRHSIMYGFLHARSKSEIKLAKTVLSKDEAIFK